jgi:hypothetical protein
MRLAIAILMMLCAAARADDAPPPIHDFDLATVERLGRAMQDQDRLAWTAADAMEARFSAAERSAQHVHGWIVEGTVVRVVRENAAGPDILCDVAFTAGKPSPCVDPADRVLRGEELAQYRARMLAIASVERPCSQHYNTIALKDPKRGGWLVWALAATTDPDAVVIGGHYRFFVSADGSTLTGADALSHSCLSLTKPSPGSGDEASVFVSHIVSPRPVETHVFASLSYGVRLDVGTDDGKTWRVDGDRIAEVSMDDRSRDGYAARMFAGHNEVCSAILAQRVDGATKYFVGGGVQVIAPTETADKLVVTAPSKGDVVSVACTRDDLVPAPNDYKVLLAGYGLYITRRGDQMSGELKVKDGKIAFAIKNGAAPDRDTQQRIDARLAAFQAALAKPPR